MNIEWIFHQYESGRSFNEILALITQQPNPVITSSIVNSPIIKETFSTLTTNNPDLGGSMSGSQIWRSIGYDVGPNVAESSTSGLLRDQQVPVLPVIETEAIASTINETVTQTSPVSSVGSPQANSVESSHAGSPITQTSPVSSPTVIPSTPKAYSVILTTPSGIDQEIDTLSNINLNATTSGNSSPIIETGVETLVPNDTNA